MKLSSSIAVLSTLLLGVKANFDIYQVRSGGNGISSNKHTWGAFNPDPGCDQFWDQQGWPQKEDLNGKHGFRPEYNSAHELILLEFNFMNYWHYTWYADRPDGGMYGLGGEVFGKCYLFPLPEQYCAEDLGQLYAERIMRCESDLTVEQINSVK